MLSARMASVQTDHYLAAECLMQQTQKQLEDQQQVTADELNLTDIFQPTVPKPNDVTTKMYIIFQIIFQYQPGLPVWK